MKQSSTKKREIKFNSTEEKNGFAKGQAICLRWGFQLLETEKKKGKQLSEFLKDQIGIGAAYAVWAGIHYHKSKTKIPFEKGTPAYGLFQAGRRWYDGKKNIQFN